MPEDKQDRLQAGAAPPETAHTDSAAGNTGATPPTFVTQASGTSQNYIAPVETTTQGNLQEQIVNSAAVANITPWAEATAEANAATPNTAPAGVPPAATMTPPTAGSITSPPPHFAAQAPGLSSGTNTAIDAVSAHEQGAIYVNSATISPATETTNTSAKTENPTRDTDAIDEKKPADGKKPRRAGKAGRGRAAAVFALFVSGFFLTGMLLYAGLQLREARRFAALHDTANLPQVTVVAADPEEEGLSTIEIIEKVSPSVVSIDLYDQGRLETIGSGSGIIFSEDGYIITNNHVVEDAFAIRVVLQNGRGYTATLVEHDAANDLAVIKIDAEGLQPAEFGNSDNVQVGQVAIAIGNAAGLFPGSPTKGIISGVNRELTMQTSDGRTVTRLLLQTDAAINPGNSGGALVNMYGQVIGINVAKLNSTEIDNIGFAIPVKVALPMMQALTPYEELLPARPLIGITLRELNETNGPANGLPEKGLYINSISAASDLNNHPVKRGDVLLQADGKPLTTLGDLEHVLEQHTAGETIKLLVYRPTEDDTIEIDVLLYS